VEAGYMSQSDQKLVQYLNEAHATEAGLVRVLQSQIAMTPRGSYRDLLEKHLDETRNHADRVRNRIKELDGGANPLQAGVGAVETIFAQTLALWKTPFDLVRGTSGEEKILKNAKDTSATEALEIATYIALERVATAVGDDATARLAKSIRADEERMLERVTREIPKLAAAVVGAEIEDDPSYDVTKTGAADAARKATRRTTQRAKRATRSARKAPGVARAQGAAKGAVASAGDLPIARYDKLTAEEITGRLNELSQADLAKVAVFERKNDNRSTVLDRISSLQGDEPWAGYDELNVDEVRAALGDDEQRIKRVREYERAHKNRTSVLEATERELTNA
jgi:ferritin-like metal-binding protein YciE